MDFFASAVSWIKDMIVAVIDLLPDSPFSFDIPASIHTIIGYVNYFVPVGQMVVVLTGWTACILVYYGASLLMRWIKAIE